MRHRNKKAKLNRTSSHRKAMVANMVCSLLDHELINTTETKAREVRRTVESMITFAKKGDLHARRQVLRLIPNKRVVGKLFSELGPRYASRSGGYTRMVKSAPRRGDAAGNLTGLIFGRHVHGVSHGAPFALHSVLPWRLCGMQMHIAFSLV